MSRFARNEMPEQNWEAERTRERERERERENGYTRTMQLHTCNVLRQRRAVGVNIYPRELHFLTLDPEIRQNYLWAPWNSGEERSALVSGIHIRLSAVYLQSWNFYRQPLLAVYGVVLWTTLSQRLLSTTFRTTFYDWSSRL